MLRSANMEVDYAEDGKQAMDMILADPKNYSAIIMDVALPVINGVGRDTIYSCVWHQHPHYRLYPATHRNRTM